MADLSAPTEAWDRAALLPKALVEAVGIMAEAVATAGVADLLMRVVLLTMSFISPGAAFPEEPAIPITPATPSAMVHTPLLVCRMEAAARSSF